MVREAAIPALPLDGKLASKVIREKVKDRISAIAAKADGTVPGLRIVMANGFVLFFGSCSFVRACGTSTTTCFGWWFGFPLEVTGGGGSTD